MKEKLTFLDVFAGIGGFRLGMELAGHKCIGHVERDEYARNSYNSMHKVKLDEWSKRDITKITNEEFSELGGKVDVICGGFPCQSFSISGERKGFEDVRGTMFFELARAAKEIKPSYLFFENVKGLLSHDKGRSFETILKVLYEIGYDAEWSVINSKYFGVPQNRERVYIIGHLRGRCTSKVFNFKRENKGSNISKIKISGKMQNSEDSIGQRDVIYSSDGIIGSLLATDYIDPKKISIRKDIKLDNSFKQTSNIYNSSGIAPTIMTPSGGSHIPHIYKNDIVRRLTPREYFRLQGFKDEYFDRARRLNSDAQLYKQAGNSVTVTVIKWIGERLKIEC